MNAKLSQYYFKKQTNKELQETNQQDCLIFKAIGMKKKEECCPNSYSHSYIESWVPGSQCAHIGTANTTAFS